LPEAGNILVGFPLAVIEGEDQLTQFPAEVLGDPVGTNDSCEVTDRAPSLGGRSSSESELVLRHVCGSQPRLWRPGAGLLIAIFVVLASACSDNGDSAPTATESARATAAPNAVSEACATSPASSPRGETILDTLSKGASTLSDLHPDFSVEVSDSSAGTSADVTIKMSLAADQVNLQAFFFTIPDEWRIVPGCAIALGRTVGTLSWLTTLGIINNPCNAQVPIEFTMQNASTDPTDVVDFVDNDGNLVDGFDRDNDRSGLADVIEKYPDLLDSTFPGRVPVRRSVGIATVAGTRVIAQTLIFAPLDEAVGQTLVILFQDFPTVRTTVGRTVFTDQCTPFSLTLTEFGVGDDGRILQSNPAAGTYTFAMTAFGLRDADRDGIENALDTCPFDVNVGNPRVSGDGDADRDGLDAACDPNDFASNPDEDGDDTLNRGDLCPLKAGIDLSGSQKDRDMDQIGDECDVFGSGPDIGDGDVTLSSIGEDVVIE